MKTQFILKQYLDMTSLDKDQLKFIDRAEFNTNQFINLDCLDFNIYLYEQFNCLGFVTKSKNKKFLNYFARAELKVLSLAKSPESPHLKKVRARLKNRSDFYFTNDWLCETVLLEKEKIAEKLKTKNFKILDIQLDQVTNIINILVKITK